MLIIAHHAEYMAFFIAGDHPQTIKRVKHFASSDADPSPSAASL